MESVQMQVNVLFVILFMVNGGNGWAHTTKYGDFIICSSTTSEECKTSYIDHITFYYFVDQTCMTDW